MRPNTFAGPMSLADILDRAFRIYRAHFGTLALTAAIWRIPYGVVSGVISGDNLNPEFTLFLLFIGEAGSTLVPGFVIAIVMVVGIIVQGIIALSLTSQVVAILHGTTLPMWASMRQALRRCGIFAMMYFWRGLLLLVAGVITFIITLFVFNVLDGIYWEIALTELDVYPLLQMGTLLIVLLVWVPFVGFFGRWLLAVPAIVAQKNGPLTALGVSWRLTGASKTRATIYTALLGVLYIFTLFVFAWAINITLLIFLEGMPLVASALSGIVTATLNVLWEPLFVCAVVLFYYDLRARQDSYDLAVRVANLEAALSSPGASLYEASPS